MKEGRGDMTAATGTMRPLYRLKQLDLHVSDNMTVYAWFGLNNCCTECGWSEPPDAGNCRLGSDSFSQCVLSVGFIFY